MVATGACLAVVGTLSACGSETETDDLPEALTPPQFVASVERAVIHVGGLTWTEEVLPDPDQALADEASSEELQERRSTGVMVASTPVQSHVVVTGPRSGELLVGQSLICHQGLYTSAELPFTWPEHPVGRPWNCLPTGDPLWAMVGSSLGISRDPLTLVRHLDVSIGWKTPVVTGEGDEVRTRYEFDGHRIWLDSDQVPRRVESLGEYETVWTIEHDADAEVTLPPRRERTSLSPVVGRQHVGSCCLPMGEPPTGG